MNERDLPQAAGDPADQPLRIVILAGQSNAQGWMGDGRLFEKDPGDAKIPFRWMICGHNPMLPGESQKGRGWETLGPQNGICGHGNPASHFGPEISMARKLAKAGRQVAVLKVTIGASSLYGDWRLPGQKGLTDDMLAEVKEALADLNKVGRKAEIGGFIWIQGESDADSDEHAKGFQGILTELIAGLREEWNEPSLPVILGLDEQHPGPVGRPRVVEAQKAIAEVDKNAAFTSMVGLEKADVSHLTNAGLEKHGERIAEALTKIWERKSNFHRDAEGIVLKIMNRPTLVTASRVWTAAGAGAISDGAVLIRAGRIAAVAPAVRFADAADLERIELGDVTLLPGLVDAHAHLYGREWDGRLLLVHGVTTVRDVGNRFPEIVRLRERQSRGDWIGPRLQAWGPLLDADPPHWPHIARGIRADENVESVVDGLLDGGADGCKTYYRAPASIMERVVAQAHRRGKRVSCHAGATQVSTALAAGMDCVEHTVTLAADVLPPGQGWHALEPDSPAVTRLIRLFKDQGAWFDPTLGVTESERFWWGPQIEKMPGYALIPPDLRAWFRECQAVAKDSYHWDTARLAEAAEGFRRSQALVRRFYEDGVPLLAGSDMPFLPPGVGLRYEMQLLAGAGIPNGAVLRMATASAADFLGLADRIGRLAPGCAADMVAVDGDPLHDMAAMGQVAAVWQDGRRLDLEPLRQQAAQALAELSAAYDPARPPFGISAPSDSTQRR